MGLYNELFRIKERTVKLVENLAIALGSQGILGVAAEKLMLQLFYHIFTNIVK